MPLSYKFTSSPVSEPMTLDEAKAQLVVDIAFADDDDLIERLITAARTHIETLINRSMFPRTMKAWFDSFPTHTAAIRLPKPPCLSVEGITYIPIVSGGPLTLDPAKYFVDINAEPARIVPMGPNGQFVPWPYTAAWLPNAICVSFTTGAFVKLQVDALIVAAAPGPYVVQLTNAADCLDIVALVDGAGNAVAFANSDGTLTVDASFAGATLTASYYLPDMPEPIKQAMRLLISHWYSHRDAAEAQPPKAIEIGVDALVAPYAFESLV